MKISKQQKPYWKMNTRELAEATKEFDKPIPASRMRPLTKEQRQQWERAKRQPSLSIYILENKRGREMIMLEMDGELLRRVHEYARSHQMSLAELIDRGMRSALSFVEGPTTRAKTRKSA